MKKLSHPRPILPFALFFASAASVFAQQDSDTRSSDSRNIAELSAFEVVTERDRGYAASGATGATRLATEIIKTPVSVIVITEEFLRDVAALDTSAAIKYVSGMNDNASPYNGQVTIRGFQQGSGISFRDGLPDDISLGGSPLLDFADIERVEVIKGPAGVMYGSHVPGGVVNRVVRRPEESRKTSVRGYAGHWNLYRVDLDTTGPLDSDKRLLYRFIASVQSGEAYFRGFNDKVFLSPHLTYRFNDATSVSAKYVYYHPKVSTSRNPWFADRDGQISTFLPRRGFFDENDEIREHWKNLYDFEARHAFSPDWQFRFVARYADVEEDKLNYNKVRYNFMDADGNVFGNHTNASFSDPRLADVIVDRARRRDLLRTQRRGFFGDLVGKFNTGPISHTLLTSVQHNRNDTQDGQFIGAFPSISAFNPVHIANPEAVAPTPNETRNIVSDSRGFSFAVQNNLAFANERLIVALGARRDQNRNGALNRRTGAASDSSASAWSYKAGAVYQAVPGLGLFYNYSETFQPVSGTNNDGIPFKNQLGSIHEFGIKVESPGGFATGTASYFNLELDNFVRTVIIDLATGTTDRIQSGINKVEGVELDFAFQPMPNISMLAAFGYLTSKDENGVRARNVSQGVNWRVFGKYDFRHDSRLSGLTLGGGIVNTGERAGDFQDTFTLPGYTIGDVFAAYRVNDNFRLQVNVTNVTDKTYVGSSVVKQFVYPGRPREIVFSTEYTF